ncbi:peptidoglycan editing factor PgeF [Clostridiaceae bacterium 35-E11]
MSDFFMHQRKNNISYFTIPSFDETGLVKNCFTGRRGGVSQGSYASLNMGFKTNDEKAYVLENFRIIGRELDIPIENFVYSDQVHKDHIRIVKEEDRGKGIIRDSDIKEIDAFVTNVKNIALVTVYADCVPIFLLDPIQKVIALAHAGWRGTVLKIASKTINVMTQEFGTNPTTCLAAIGPSIGKCCYEVDEAVIDVFNNNFTNLHEFVFSKGNNKYMLDLWKANKIVLKEIGILDRNITISNLCTMCHHEELFSHRGDHGNTGRMAAILQLI